MSDQYCDICKKEPAVIQINGKGKYCLNCHNTLMLKKFGQNNTYDYPSEIYVMEPSEEIHTFRITHMILGGKVSWEAEEQGGHYHFHEMSDLTENGAVAASHFFQKVIDGVCTKTLQESSMDADNLLNRDGRHLSLKDKGTIRILDGKNRETIFEIDGQLFSAEEFGKMLGSYAGLSLQYQVHNASEPVLHENEYLVPIKITKEELTSELEQAVSTYGDGNFISYKDVFAFDEVFFHILKKLEVLTKCGDYQEALDAGKEMVRILLNTDTDDDDFPEYLLECIGSTVDPYWTDEELKQLIASLYNR